MDPLAALLPALSRATAESGLGLLTLRAPAGALERFLDLPIPGEMLVWNPAGPECGGRAWSLAGRGIAARVEGDADPARVRERAEAILDRLVERRDPGAWDAPAPRFFGGMSFTRDACGDAWQAFGASAFALPRWLYGERDGEAFLRLAVDRSALREVDRLAEELQSVLRRLAQPVTRAPEGEVPVRGRVEEQARGEWDALVGAALAGIEAGRLEKVVVARRTRVTTESPVDLVRVVRRLRAQGDTATRFAFGSGGATFLGATPERLVQLCGEEVSCDALGGSLPRGAGADREPATLLTSAKDRREHEAVVRGIRAALAPLCGAIDAPATPVVRSHAAVHHLHTPIRARLRRPAHVLDLVAALHPTPAVCGLPRREAAEFLATHERFHRGWYASPVGWFDLAGDGCFQVALRCGLVRDRVADLFAGAGIVAGSDPAAEWRETAAKARPMLAALGVEEARS